MDNKIFESLAKAQQMADRIKSTISDIENIVDYSHRLIEQSCKLVERANDVIRRPTLRFF